MDIQRIVLFAGLAIVSYLMVLAWNEDYHQPQTEQVAEAQSPSDSSATNNTDDMILPEDNNAGGEEFATP
ncbi:MAG TPA: membrane protein insertase YidC, partial [Marinobacter hydrocarbonoclasticus]|nr:membrane protein insertase YidC [Marinobacter nauticus]